MITTPAVFLVFLGGVVAGFFGTLFVDNRREVLK